MVKYEVILVNCNEDVSILNKNHSENYKDAEFNSFKEAQQYVENNYPNLILCNFKSSLLGIEYHREICANRCRCYCCCTEDDGGATVVVIREERNNEE